MAEDSKNNNILKIGHRGAKGHIAENTLASVQKAIELGVNGIEIDVHCCKSGEVVVFHDFTVDRLTNGSGAISSFTLSELKTLKVNLTYEIPTLEDVLDTIDSKCLLNIELKGQNTVKAVAKTVAHYVNTKSWNYKDIIVSSFQHDLLLKLYDLNQEIQLGILTDTNLEEAVDIAKKLNAVAIHPNFTMLTKENVAKIKTENFKVYTWTVNEKKDIERMKTYKIDGIISDYPDRI